MIVPVSLKGHINKVRGYPLMRKLLSITFVAVIGVSLMLTGCESTQGAGERIGNDLKKTSKKVEKGIKNATKDLRKNNQQGDH